MYQCHGGDLEDLALGGAKIPLVRCPVENEEYHLSAGVRFYHLTSYYNVNIVCFSRLKEKEDVVFQN